MENFLSTIILQDIKLGGLDWIGKIIRTICEKPAYGIGIGIIIFTIILKLITLPFDVMSKVSMKKNAIKMEKMRPELEKLQKQYANNKQLYQQKVMAVQKKAGYSPFSSCLPTILSIIIFFIVIGAFQDYSNYANKRFASSMVNAYNQKIIEMDIGPTINDKGEYISKNLDIEKIKAKTDYQTWKDQNYTNKYLTDDTLLYNDLASESLLNSNAVNGLTKRIDDYFSQVKTTVEEKEVITYVVIEGDGKTAQEVKDILVDFYVDNYVPIKYFDTVLIKEAQTAAKQAYIKEKSNVNFLWIKNIWVADSTFKHPIEGASAYGMDAESYTTLTGEMAKEKSAKNGYFILVVLSVVVMFLSQLVNEKEQKAQMELQTVEGADSTANQTQKLMKWIMPIMFGFFAFMYTSAFSIYMITSSLFSLLSSLVINIIVKKVFAKKEQQELENKDKRLKIKK